MAKKAQTSKIVFDFNEPRIKALIGSEESYLFEKFENQIEDFPEVKNRINKILKTKLKSLKFFAKPTVEALLPVDFSKAKESELIEIFKNLGVVNIIFSFSIVNEAKTLDIPIEEKQPTVLVSIRNNKAEIAILSSNKIVSSDVVYDFETNEKSKVEIDRLIERIKSIIQSNLKNFSRGVIFIGETKFIQDQKEFFIKTLNLPIILI